VGKSRLLLELQRALAGRRSAYVEGRCLSFGAAMPYVPVLDVVRGLCGVGDADPVAATREAARAAAVQMGVDAALVPFLLHLLGVAGDELPGGLGPEAIKARTFEAIRHLVARAAAQRPLVIAVEDLHWIDRTSEECLAAIVERLAGLPVMLLTTYRPGYRPPWIDRSYATQIALRRLAPADSLTVVRSVLSRAGLGDPLAALILDKAEGNPFFLEELARAADDHGLDRPGLIVPDTVHGVLAARIDRLPEVPKRLLQTASVLGREFTLPLLQAVWDGDGPEHHLRELTRQEFLYERSGPEGSAFVFKHALTQDVARAGILAPRRRDLHARAAAALVTLNPARVEELAPVLAHHYAQAEDWPAACEHATRAAERAGAAFANREALEGYDQALHAAERAMRPPAERMRLLAARGQVHGVLGAFEPARLDLEQALAIAREIDAATCTELLGALGELWGGHRDYRRGLELTGEAVRTAEAAGDQRGTAEALVRSALMHLNLGRMTESQRELTRALAIFEALGDERGGARTLDVLAMNDGISGRIELAIERGREALRRFQRLGDRAAQPSVISNIGFWLGLTGHAAEAEPQIRQGRQAAIELGARADEAYAHLALALLGEQRGDYPAALRENESALALAREIGHREWIAAALWALGRLTRLCGAPERARVLHEEMLGIARPLGAALWIAGALDELGEDLVALGREAEGEPLLHETIEAAGEATEFVLPALLALAELRLRRGDAEEARRFAGRAEVMAGDYRSWQLHARRLDARALIALGRVPEGEEILEDVKQQAGALGFEPVVWRGCLDLAEQREGSGQAAAGAALREEARAGLERVASGLPDDLRAAFAAGPLMRRAR
jgi:tetratricopeptide (TPR) repeat protein